jgi:hypothetical protein
MRRTNESLPREAGVRHFCHRAPVPPIGALLLGSAIMRELAAAKKPPRSGRPFVSSPLLHMRPDAP